jgi:CelD/BcsL family acetyltransferase involved in cellulose biosynthesis
MRQDPHQIPSLTDRWASTAAPFYVPPLEDFLSERNRGQWRILTGRDGVALLPFLIQTHMMHKFTVAERKLGTMRLRSLTLINPWLVKDTPVGEIAAALRYALRSENVDLLQLGEIPNNWPLRAALDSLRWPAQPKRVGRKDSIRWLIELPESFEAYMSQLSPSTRQSIKRKMRRLHKDFDVSLEIFDRPEGLETFLEKGEAISRLTYQWHVGQRLVNDTETLNTYRRLARAGRIRCYLMSLNGVPRAFLRGKLQDRLYHYETPGFDPAFGRTSIGTILLMEALRDLIEQTDVEVFDFGTGGDDVGYKSTYGTRAIPSAQYYVLNLHKPAALSILTLESGLDLAKNIADRVLKESQMRGRVKRWLRK